MREKETSTRIIFVRHGEADFPKDRIYCDDREDPPLTAAGQDQACHAATMLSRAAVDAILASPMQRTTTTAELIGREVRAPLSHSAELRERRFGVWDGLYFNEIEQHYPDAYRQWKQDPVGFTPEGGETIHDLQSRIQAVITRLITEYPGQSLVVVSHVGPIRVAVADALGLPLLYYRRLTVDYGSLTCIDYGNTQNNLRYLNFKEHFK